MIIIIKNQKGKISIEFPTVLYLFAIINKISHSLSTVAVAQWVRHWSRDHKVVQAEGSSPGGDTYQTFFQQ